MFKFCVKVVGRLGRKKLEGVGQVKSAHCCICKEKRENYGEERAVKLEDGDGAFVSQVANTYFPTPERVPQSNLKLSKV